MKYLTCDIKEIYIKLIGADVIKNTTFIPIFLHNLTNYDAHFIVKELHCDEGEINVIPLNKNKYISFSKELMIGEQTVTLRFLDSFRFMSESLSSLAKNFELDNFKE